MEAPTFRALLLLLYGAGLRRGEALRLTATDVDLRDALLTVRDSKFYKSRLVPVGQQLSQALQEYATWREAKATAQRPDSTFLVNRDGTPLAVKTAHKAFNSLRQAAGISAANARGVQPCFHSLRHTFAVHRLTSWYRQGADVQRLLPFLSAYLGHANLSGTQVYLSMTPELLQQASQRFEHYMKGDCDV